MTSTIYNAIEAVAQKRKISFTTLNFEESRKIHREVTFKFADSVYEQDWLWEYLNDSLAIQNPSAWRWISEFNTTDPIILFFNPSDEKSAFEFPDIHNIIDILKDTFGFEFYLCNKNLDYLLCFNHHDFLIACGTAKSWLQSKL